MSVMEKKILSHISSFYICVMLFRPLLLLLIQYFLVELSWNLFFGFSGFYFAAM